MAEAFKFKDPFSFKDPFDSSPASNSSLPAEIPAEENEAAGDFGAGWDAGVSSLKSLGGAFVAAAGHASGVDEIREWGLGVMDRNESDAGNTSEGRIASIEQIKSGGDFVDYAQYTLGQLAPFALESTASMIAGAVIGSSAPGAGTVIGAGAGLVGKKAIKEAIKAYVKGEVKDKAQEEVAKRALRRAGAAAGAFAGGYPIGVGDVYSETVEADDASPGIAFAAGAPYALIDAIPEVGALSRLLKGGKGNIVKRVAGGTAKQSVSEGLSEYGQEELLIQIRGALDNEFDVAGEEANSRRMNAGAAGAIGGSVPGAVSGIPSRSPADDNPTPEANSTMDAQMDAFTEGRKRAVLFTPGESIPENLPPGSTIEELDDGKGVLLYRQDDPDALEQANTGKLGEVLGYGVDEKPAGSEQVVTARDSQGRVVADVVTDGRQKVVDEAQRAAGEGGTVEERTAEEALTERQQERRAEQKKAAQVARRINVKKLTSQFTSGEIDHRTFISRMQSLYATQPFPVEQPFEDMPSGSMDAPIPGQDFPAIPGQMPNRMPGELDAPAETKSREPVAEKLKALPAKGPDPMIVFPDGTTGRKSEIDAYLADLEARGATEEAMAFRAKTMGFPGELGRPDEPTTATEAKLPPGVQGGDILTSKGATFKNQPAARAAIKRGELEDYQPYQVKSGWVVRPTEQIERAEREKIEPKRTRDDVNREDRTPDQSKDSLTAAIAKLGGVSLEEAESQGIDPAHFGDRGHKISRIFTQGGMGFDAMAETLSQYGYPVTDENGNYTANGLLDALTRSLSGKSVKAATGFEAEMEAEALEREEEYREREVAGDFDELTLDIDDLAQNEDYSEFEQILAEKIARAESVLGESAVETILERAAMQAESDADYMSVSVRLLEEAINEKTTAENSNQGPRTGKESREGAGRAEAGETESQEEVDFPDQLQVVEDHRKRFAKLKAETIATLASADKLLESEKKRKEDRDAAENKSDSGLSKVVSGIPVSPENKKGSGHKALARAVAMVSDSSEPMGKLTGIYKIKINLKAMLDRGFISREDHDAVIKETDKIEAELKAEGFEIVDSIGKKHNEDNKVIAEFSPTSDPTEDGRVISVAKPMVLKNGIMVQVAHYTVGQYSKPDNKKAPGKKAAPKQNEGTIHIPMNSSQNPDIENYFPKNSINFKRTDVVRPEVIYLKDGRIYDKAGPLGDPTTYKLREEKSSSAPGRKETKTEETTLTIVEQGKEFKTGKPVTLRFIRNSEKSPDMGSRFQQDIEPSGRYLVHNEKPGTVADNLESGEVTFNNPLVIEINTVPGEIYDENSWKMRLSERYGGKTGKALSSAIKKAGFDGIVTVDLNKDGSPRNTSEIVDLTVAENKSTEKNTAPEQGVEEETPLYSGYERETSNLSDRQRGQGVSQPGADAGSGQAELFDNLPSEKTEAKSQLADNFLVEYKQVATSHFNSGLDTVNYPEEVAHVVAPLRKHGQESFLAVVTDENGKILNIIRNSKGTKDGATVEPAIVAGAVASTDGAAKVWFVHNHPTGISTPSSADFSITERLIGALDGAGINFQGHIVLGSGRTASFFDTPNSSMEFEIKPAVRNKKINLTERMIRKQPKKNRTKFESPQESIQYIRGIESDNAILLLDNRHNLVGSVSMTADEMATLREGGRVRRLLSAIDKTNAIATIVVSSSEDSAKNTARFINKIGGIRVLDAFIKDGRSVESSALSGKGIESSSGEFFSKSKIDTPVHSAYSLLSKKNDPPRGITQEQATDVINKFAEEYKGSIDLSFIFARDKVHAFGADAARKFEGERVKGAYYGRSRRVLLIGSDLDSVEDAYSTLRHEVLAHHGLNTFKPADKQAIIDRIKESRSSKSVQKLWRKIDKEYAEANENTKAEEVLAHLAQNKPSRLTKLWNDLLILIRKGLRAIGLIGKNPGRPEIIRMTEVIADRVRQRAPMQTFPESDAAQFSETGPAPVFYSQMQRTLAESLPGKGTAQSYKQTIQAFAKKGYFKQEELDFSGIEEWLDSFQGRKVTKDQVLEFLRANEIQVQEVEKGGEGSLTQVIAREIFDGEWPNDFDSWLYESNRMEIDSAWDDPSHVIWDSLGKTKEDYISENDDIVDAEESYRDGALNLSSYEYYSEDEFNNLKDEAWETFEVDYDRKASEANDELSLIASIEDRPESTKFSQYQLPGGENYRELLLTLPSRKTKYDSMNKDQLRKEYESLIGHDPFSDDIGLSEKEVRDILTSRNAEAGIQGENFRSGHYAEPNILAHIRFNTRYIAEGSGVKKNDLGVNFLEFASSQLDSGETLDVMNRSVQGMRQNAKIAEAIIKAIPVDVVNSLRDFKISADSLFNDNSVGAALASMPVEISNRVVDGVAAATVKTEASLRAKIISSLSAGLDAEILPAMRTSDLDSGYVLGVLAGSGSGSAVSLDSLQSQDVGTNPAARTFSGVGAGGKKLSAADLTKLLDTHSNFRSLNKKDPTISERKNKVLFIEEVQSDWHQSGRKLGYKKNARPVRDRLAHGYNLPSDTLEWNGAKLRDAGVSDEDIGLWGKEIEIESGGVPNAPFKTTWPLLVMKRMIRYASENGFDSIAWTTGEQQAERYDLSKQVDGVRYNADGDIAIIRKGDLTISGIKPYESLATNVPKEKVADYIGKDAAEKLINTKPDAEGNREISGLNLKVGGSGMKTFYDSMLPKMVNKYVKKWGGKVGETKIAAGNGGVSSIEEGRALVKNDDLTEDDIFSTVQSITITPSMRDAVMQGEQPLFSKSRITGTEEQEAAIAATIDTPDNETPWRQRIKDSIQKLRDIDGTDLRQGLIDEFASIEALEKGFYGKVVDARVSPSKAARRTKNLDSVMAAMMLKGPLEYTDGAFQIKEGGKGFTEIFDNLSKKGLLHLWEGWAAANRANRLMKEGREHNFTQKQIDELLKLEDKYPEFRTALNEYQAFNKGVLDMAEKVGVIDGEARKLWEQNDYVPFFRAMEDVLNGEVQVKGPSNTRGLSGQKSGIKTLKGGEDKIGSVIENMVMNAAHLVDASFKTVALRRVVDLADGVTMEKVEPGFQPVGIDAGQIVTTLRKAGIIPSAKVARKIAKETGVNVGAPLSASERKQYLNMFRRVAPAGNDIISVMNKGKPEYYRVTDPLLLRAVTNMGVRNVQGMMKLMRGSKRLLTAMVTADPAFMVANFIRDTLSTVVVSHVGLKPGVDAVKGFAAALKEDPALLAIMAAGGGGGGYYHATPAEIKENLHHHLNEFRDKRFRETVLDSPKKLWRAWQKVGAASENANRIAIFKAVKGKGGSTAEAVHQAQDILNFTQTGDFAAMRFLIETVPFMNARIQGLDRLYRGAKEDPRGFALKGMMITGATLALLASNWDDDEYDELQEWDRDTYWHFFLGEKDKNGRSEYHYRLPKPFEVGAIFGTIPERFARGAAGKDDTKILVKTVGRMFGETFAMNPIPQLFKPVVEQYSNKTFFTGAPIIGMALQRLKPEAQYDPWTGESMRALAEAMPDFAPDWLRSPKRLETALRGYLGTIGAYAVETSDKLVREIGDYPDRPALRVDDIPVAKRFVRGSPPRSTKYTGQFYDMVRDANEVYSTVKRYRQQGRVEKAGKLAADNAGKLRARKALNRMARRMTAINNRIKRAYSSRDMTRQEKREAVDKLTIQKQQLVRQAGRFAEWF